VLLGRRCSPLRAQSAATQNAAGRGGARRLDFECGSRFAAGRNGNGVLVGTPQPRHTKSSPARCASSADPNASACQPLCSVDNAARRCPSCKVDPAAWIFFAPAFPCGSSVKQNEARGPVLRRERFGFSNIACRNLRRSPVDSAPKKSTESHRHASSRATSSKASDDGNRAGWGARVKDTARVGAPA
jgi:hypothetical protein